MLPVCNPEHQGFEKLFLLAVCVLSFGYGCHRIEVGAELPQGSLILKMLPGYGKVLHGQGGRGLHQANLSCSETT